MANFQILGPLGCQGWVFIPQNVKKIKNHCTLGQCHPSNPYTALNGVMLPSWDHIIKSFKKTCRGTSSLLYPIDEPSHTTIFEWQNNTLNISWTIYLYPTLSVTHFFISKVFINWVFFCNWSSRNRLLSKNKHFWLISIRKSLIFYDNASYCSTCFLFYNLRETWSN